MKIVKPIFATIFASVSSSLILAGFFTYGGRSSFGFMAEFLPVLLYSLAIIALVGLVLVWPAMRLISKDRLVWRLPYFVVASGVAGGAIMIAICMYTGWPAATREAWIAYSLAGAVAGIVFAFTLRHPSNTIT